MPAWRTAVVLSGLVAILALATAEGGEIQYGGDVRYYQFLPLEDTGAERLHAELGIFRLKLTGFLTDELRVEAHGVALFSSPPVAAAATSVASGGTRRFFDLEYRFIDNEDLRGVAEIDRLYLRWDHTSFRLVAGRQALTWGVNFFWPVLDLFAPFAPERIDREYKPGVDAVRLTVPMGDFSEVEVVAAGQVSDLPDGLSLGTLGRFHTGAADLGFMAGRFHGDIVLGGFVTADFFGTGLRGEAAFTDSDEQADEELERGRFLRLTGGFDRQLTPTLTLMAEVSWNGFGAEEAEDYLEFADSDRVSRGEVTSLGRAYTGVSLAWLAHPLVMVSGAVLTNWGDGSFLLQPFAEWSASDNVAVVFGGLFGSGPGLDSEDQLQSEYGIIPRIVYGAVRAYF